MPSVGEIEQISEPWVAAQVITPTDYIGPLMELATTWDEIDYSTEAVIPPCDWMDFAAAHNWRDPELASRLFSLAIDVASRRPEPALAGRGWR